MRLLLSQPLWLVVLLITVAVHVGFVLAIRRLIAKDRERAKERADREQREDDPR